MKFLKDKRRAGIIGVLAALLGTGSLFIGAGTAQAGYPCNDNPFPQDTNVNVSNTVFVGADTGATNPGNGAGWLWVCVGAPGGEASQKWVLVTTGDPAQPGPGFTVRAGGCTGVLSGDPFGPGCTYLLEPVGANVELVPSPNSPGGGNGTGGVVRAGPGTCVWLHNTTPFCPVGGITVAGVTVNETDLLPVVETTSTSPPPPCTGINNTCPGLRLRTQNSSDPTLT